MPSTHFSILERRQTHPWKEQPLQFSRHKYYFSLLNFGVVLLHEPYVFYRSSFLGKWGLKLLYQHLNRNKLPFPKSIIYLNDEGYGGNIPIFGKFAEEEVLLQKKYGYHFFHPYGKEGSTYIDGINPYHFQINLENFHRVMNILLNPKNSPALIHCFAGKHRTGMVALTLRYLQGGNWLQGQSNMASLNPAQYEYYLHNKSFFRHENLSFVERVSRENPNFPLWQDEFNKHYKISF